MATQQEKPENFRQESVENDVSGLEKPSVERVETIDALTPDLENRGAIKGDDSDGRVNWTTKQVLATIFLSGLYVGQFGRRNPSRFFLRSRRILMSCSTGSQLPLFFVGGSLAFIANDIGGAVIEAWMPISYSLSLAAVAPFCGYLQDLFGRRNITLAGGTVLCVGIIVVATAHSIGAAITGMAIAGAGAAIGELTALAG